MAKFIVLYSGGKAPSNPKEADASMKQWVAWFGKLGGAVAEAGNPFGAATTVTASGTEEGQGGNVSNGYSIVQADNLKAASKLMKDCPILPEGGKVHLFELMAM